MKAYRIVSETVVQRGDFEESRSDTRYGTVTVDGFSRFGKLGRNIFTDRDECVSAIAAKIASKIKSLEAQIKRLKMADPEKIVPRDAGEGANQ